MRVTNISQIRDLVNGVRQSADTSAADAASPLVTFTVDKGEASGEFIGALGDARFLLKTEGTPDVTPGSTIQVDINTGEISAVVPPKKKAAATKPATPRKAKSASPSFNMHMNVMC